jgi:hypothetical protein
MINWPRRMTRPGTAMNFEARRKFAVPMDAGPSYRSGVESEFMIQTGTVITAEVAGADVTQKMRFRPQSRPAAGALPKFLLAALSCTADRRHRESLL